MFGFPNSDITNSLKTVCQRLLRCKFVIYGRQPSLSPGTMGDAP